MGVKRLGIKFHLEGTYVRTYGHRNSMTESTQWADSVKTHKNLKPKNYPNLSKKGVLKEIFVGKPSYKICFGQE